MKRKNNGYYYTLTLAFKLNCINFYIRWLRYSLFSSLLPLYLYLTLEIFKQYWKRSSSFKKIQKKSFVPIYCRKQVINIYLIQTLSCDYLEISDFKFDQYKDRKKSIVLTSRVHPGESMVSY